MTDLDLSLNELGEKSVVELTTVFGAIPKHVTNLNLHASRLWKKSERELAIVFGAIPEHVTTLNLSENQLWQKSAEELLRLFDLIQASVFELNIEMIVCKEILQALDLTGLETWDQTQFTQTARNLNLLVRLCEKINRYHQNRQQLIDTNGFACLLLAKQLEFCTATTTFNERTIRKCLDLTTQIPSEQVLDILTPLLDQGLLHLFLDAVLKADLSDGAIRTFVYRALTDRMARHQDIPDEAWFKSEENLTCALHRKNGFYHQSLDYLSRDNFFSLLCKTLHEKKNDTAETQHSFDQAAGIVLVP